MTTLRITGATLPSLGDQAALTVTHIEGAESLGKPFAYRLLLATPDTLGGDPEAIANINFKQLVGFEVCVHIELDGKGFFSPGSPGGSPFGVGKGERQICGLITRARYLKTQDRRALYEAILEPPLVLLQRSSDFRVFQNMSVIEVISSVIKGHVGSQTAQKPGYDFIYLTRLSGSYPSKDFWVQYGETDFDFVSRLIEEWGLYYCFEHSGGYCRMILCDGPSSHVANPSAAYHTIAFYPPGHKTEDEHFDDAQFEETLTSGQWVSADFDFKQPKATLQQSLLLPRNTGHNALEHFQWPNDSVDPHHLANAEQGSLLTRVRAQEMGAQGQTGHLGGNLRGLCCGHTFTLQNHPQNTYNKGEYLITHAHLSYTDKGQASGQEEYACHSTISVIPTTHVFRPQRLTPRPRTHGPQTAIVTGPAGQEVYTDPYGRVKLSFHWNRYCPKNETSSCWVRVSSHWAGAQLGSMAVPRIGQEVIVDFEGGDPDRPIVIGRVYNELNMPPWALAPEHPLMGFRSRQLTPGGGNSAAGSSNHLILDDSAAGIQAQLKSDHDSSSLSLGHIRRIQDNGGRKDARGQGFELRTDGHGAIRAKDGLLITTEGRPNAQAHITDMGETTGRLMQAHGEHKARAELASAHKAQEAPDQEQVAKDLQVQNQAVQGSGAANTSTGETPELQEPQIVLSSPAGIASTTPGSTHQHSGQHHAITSGEHTSIAAGASLLASVGQAIRLFAYKAGMKLISASQDIELQALKTSIKLLAKLNIEETAQTIKLSASKEVVINGAGSYSRWSASGIENGTTGPWVNHAASHSMVGGKSMAVAQMHLPQDVCLECLIKRADQRSALVNKGDK